ncbi:hypothetical protein MGWOODY_Clf1783 [hydrothermal vent metagenome]|uniref:Uncharacterized protein n=1 Tax=hydrothermal vent metagenome TaxID=652676 RepID=A0A170Q9P0_9ZZZZ
MATAISTSTTGSATRSFIPASIQDSADGPWDAFVTDNIPQDHWVSGSQGGPTNEGQDSAEVQE